MYRSLYLAKNYTNKSETNVNYEYAFVLWLVSHACHQKDESFPLKTDLESVLKGEPLNLGNLFYFQSVKSIFLSRRKSPAKPKTTRKVSIVIQECD